MKKVLFAIFSFMLLLSCSPDLSTEMSKFSYGVGFNIGKQLKKATHLKLDKDKILEGVSDAFAGKKANEDKSHQAGHNIASDFMTQELKLDIPAFNYGVNDGFGGNELSVPKQELDKAFESVGKRISDKNMKAGNEFLENNKTKDGVMVTKSGLQYRIITPSNGRRPGPKSKVKVHYKGRLINGKEFDSSYKRNKAVTFPLDKVIPGFTEGLQLMKVGSKVELFMPSKLGYGPRGTQGIPASSVLIFEVELLEIVR